LSPSRTLEGILIGEERQPHVPRPPHDLSTDVVLISTADWYTPHWTNKQHLAVRLGQRGMRVLYLESLGLRRPQASARDATRILRRLGAFLRGPRRVAPGVWVFSPLQVPFPSHAGVRRCNHLLLVLQLRVLQRVLGFKRPILWIFNPLVRGLKTILRPSLTVYQCVDELAAVPGVPLEAVESAERELLAEADAVITTSRPLLHSKRKSARRILLSENTVDYWHFASEKPVPDWLARIPRPRLGYVGAISSYKVDLELVGALASRNPRWQFVLIGSVGEGDPDTELGPLRQTDNVHIFGPAPYDVLPGVMRGFDVCLLPSRINRYTTGMFPMKFFEYCASGRPIVMTPLPSLEEYWESCYLGRDVGEFESAISKALGEDSRNFGVRRALARAHDWEPRIDQILNFLSRSARQDGAPTITGVRSESGLSSASNP
jgi:glycosyltransferase involved in cell wall biosynthesis